MPRVIDGFIQFFDGEGNPLVDGKLKFTKSGTNNTDKDTFADISETIPNTNPVLLDAEGRCPNIFGTGSYRATSYTSDDQQIQQFDPMPGGSESTGFWSSWSSGTIYAIGDITIGDDGKYYRSLTDTNEGNDPTDPGNAEFWEEVKLLSVYNINKAYVETEIVLFTNGSLYECIAETVAGQSPVTNPTKWQPATNTFYNSKETINDLGTLTGGTVNIDLAIADVVLATISTAETTFTFTNAPASGINKKFEFYITNGGSQTINWFSGTQFPGKTLFTLTETGTDLITFTTNTSGVPWTAVLSIQDMGVPA